MQPQQQLSPKTPAGTRGAIAGNRHFNLRPEDWLVRVCMRLVISGGRSATSETATAHLAASDIPAARVAPAVPVITTGATSQVSISIIKAVRGDDDGAGHTRDPQDGRCADNNNNHQT